MSDADLAEILKLPAEEKLRLVELLWENPVDRQEYGIVLGDLRCRAPSAVIRVSSEEPDLYVRVWGKA
jgi:hypothetical protein